ncbi:MAG: GAF domain-containing protein [candidate division Zixibacteria bacterium]|nr:GAF domain-containing protein [candidate division Zixibacteria bacterium]
MPMLPPIPQNETERLRALLDYQILESSPEKAFDDIAHLASFICDAPIAAMGLLDQRRLWFKSIIGLNVPEIHREHAFCAFTILEDGVMTIEDATKDERFSDSPLVIDEPKYRFYAGAPLINAEGFALGSLCVLDRIRRRVSKRQMDALQALARQTVSLLELRPVATWLAKATEQIQTLETMLPIFSYCKNVRNDEGYWHQVDE